MFTLASLGKSSGNVLFGYKEYMSIKHREERRFLYKAARSVGMKLRGRVTREDLIIRVNGYIDMLPYVEDEDDVWQMPDETWANGGDCEDVAILRYAELSAFGIKPDDLRIILGYKNDEPHALCVVNCKGWRVLDPPPIIPLESDMVDFRPVSGFNHLEAFVYEKDQ